MGCIPPFKNYVIKYILTDAESCEERDALENVCAMKGCKVMGIFVPKCSQKHWKRLEN